jgi:hypothetical protein
MKHLIPGLCLLLGSGCSGDPAPMAWSGSPPLALPAPQAPRFAPQVVAVAPAAPQYRVAISVAADYRDIFTFDATTDGVQPLVVPLGTFAAGDEAGLSVEVPGQSGRYVVELLPASAVPAYLEAHRPGLVSDPDGDLALFAPLFLPPRRLSEGGDYVAVLRNVVRFNGQQKVRLTLTTAHRLTAEEQQAYARQLRDWADEVERTFVLSRPLRLRLEPCGVINAFYDPTSGDVTLCTETYAVFTARKLQIDGLVYHELGHALLRMWNFPGWDQENDPDDFAVFMAFQSPARSYAIMADLAQYFLSNDPQQDVRGVMAGDPHGAGPQRAAHIEQRFRNPQEWSENWNSKIYPYMTSTHLRRVAASPRGLESQIEARRVLGTRGEPLP